MERINNYRDLHEIVAYDVIVNQMQEERLVKAKQERKK